MDRDKAKFRFKKKAAVSALQAFEIALQKKGIGYPELAALSGVKSINHPERTDEQNVKTRIRGCAESLASLMFELGYEISFTRIPITVSKLKEIIE